MMINRLNYEQYVIDFLEGKLSKSDTLLFNEFLNKNSDIALEISNLQIHSFSLKDNVPSVDFSFLQKDINAQSIDDSNFEEMCIAFFEGDLNLEAGENLKRYIKNFPACKQKFEKYKKLKLVPERTIVYNNKNQLKHTPEIYFVPTRPVIIGILAAAASVAIFLLFQTPVRNILLETPLQTSFTHSNNEQTNSKQKPVLTIPTARMDKVTPHTPPGNLNTSPYAKQPLLAVADSTGSEEDEFIRISMIEPTTVTENQEMLQDMKLHFNPEYKPATLSKPNKMLAFREKSRRFINKARHLTVNEVIETSIKGINSIAETDLRYIAQTDEKGKIKELELSTDNFNIYRKSNN
jgi:hypothetical protein